MEVASHLPETVTIEPGQFVKSGDELYRIVSRAGVDTVYAAHHITGEHDVLAIGGLVFISGEEARVAVPDLADIPESDRAEMYARGKVIKALYDCGRISLERARAAAAELVVSVPTIYRLVRRYRETGRLSSLIPAKPNGGRGKMRLAPEVDATVRGVIETFYLTKQQRTIRDAYDEVVRVCRESGARPPTYEAVRLRIKALPPRVRLERRAHKKEARDKYLARGGQYDEARFPLAIVQIDHTPLDIMVVDRVLRRSIGRPYITVAIDVYSRMVVGFVVTLEPPSANTVGLCIRHLTLSKDAYLARLGVTNEWPCWGLPHAIHTDNAKEFHGEMLQFGCDEWAINKYHRPVQNPHFAGVVERFFKTLNGMLRPYPGYTSSNPKARGEYDPDSAAVLTLDDLEKIIAEWITGQYHAKQHGGLLMPPLEKWRQAILGLGETPALPQRKPRDEERFALDFTPMIRRTLQHYGFRIDEINYYGDVLRPHIADMRREARQFIIRRDPQDISYVHMWDPTLHQYFRIPYRDQTRPAITLWELRAVRAELKKDGAKNIDESQIFASYEKMRAIEAAAVVETKRARRMRERRTIAASKRSSPAPAPQLQEPQGSLGSNVVAFAPRINLSNVVPYEMEDDD